MINEFRIFGPPGCLDANTIVNIRRGKRNFGRPITIQMAYYKFNRLDIPQWMGANYPWRGNHPALIMSLQNDIIMYHEIDAILDSGFKKLYKVTTTNNRSICVTKEHPFKVPGGFLPLHSLKPGMAVFCKTNKMIAYGRQKNKKRKIVYSVKYHPYGWKHLISGKNYKRISYAKAVYEAYINNITIKTFIEIIRHQKEKATKLKYLPRNIIVHHKDGNQLNDNIDNLELITKKIHDKYHGIHNIRNFGYFKPRLDIITFIEPIGIGQTYDIVMKPPHHNYVAQEFIVHNTGKTSRLATRDIPRAIEKYGSEGVMVTSFTKAAAREISQKKSRQTGSKISVAQQNVGTIHSILYHALGQPSIMEVHYASEWNEAHPRYRMTGNKVQTVDESCSDGGTLNGDRLLNAVNIKRSRMLPMTTWSRELKTFYNKWCEFKKEVDCMDFTDLIEQGIHEFDKAPNNPKVIFVDEAQDFTKLQLSIIRKWGEHTDWVVLVGDDDQASLPGTFVQTITGNVLIEDLDPNKHELTSYGFDHCSLVGFNRKGSQFEIKPSKYNDLAVKVYCNNKVTKTTHNHSWVMRWNNSAKKKTIVYLMRKNNSFRVGWCQLIRADNCCHFQVRCKLENADTGWILKICDSRSEASLWESFIAAKFGISTVIWKPMHDQSNGHYSKEIITTLFSMLGNHTYRGMSCLSYFKKDINFPFYKKNERTKHGSPNNKIHACNLFPEIMDLPVRDNNIRNGVNWYSINKIDRFRYSGIVYGLNVEKNHTYIADGLVTHNCIYEFTGADPKTFINPPLPDKFKTVLNQSYRVPQTILQRSLRLIQKVKTREPKLYSPRTNENGIAIGEVRKIPHTYNDPIDLIKFIKPYISENMSIMFLASCAYMLEPLKQKLKEDAIPFHNPYRKRRGDWNPLHHQDTLLNFLESGIDESFWNIPQFVSWAKHLQVGDGTSGLVRNVGNKGIKRLKLAIEEHESGLHTCRDVINDLLVPSAVTQAMDRNIDWFVENISPAKKKVLEYPTAIYKKHGIEGLNKEPNIILGTIHSVKGAEADIVCVFPDISYIADQEMGRKHGRDSMYRLFYVAMTRAKRKLILCNPVVMMNLKEPRMYVEL